MIELTEAEAQVALTGLDVWSRESGLSMVTGPPVKALAAKLAEQLKVELPELLRSRR